MSFYLSLNQPATIRNPHSSDARQEKKGQMDEGEGEGKEKEKEEGYFQCGQLLQDQEPVQRWHVSCSQVYQQAKMVPYVMRPQHSLGLEAAEIGWPQLRWVSQ
ncbi:hypothetical protein PAMP_024451 [Pampus punctatissimus]